MFRSSTSGRLWLVVGAALTLSLALLTATASAVPADHRVTSHMSRDFQSVVNVGGEDYLFTGTLQVTATVYDRNGETMADLHSNFARASVLELSTGRLFKLTGSQWNYETAEVADPGLPPGEDGDIEAIEFKVLLEAAKSAQEDLKAIMDGVKVINNSKAQSTSRTLVEVDILIRPCPEQPCAEEAS